MLLANKNTLTTQGLATRVLQKPAAAKMINDSVTCNRKSSKDDSG